MHYQTIPAKSSAEELQKAKAIISAICKYFGLPEEDICKRCRKQQIVKVRQWCCYMVARETSLTLITITQLIPCYGYPDVIKSKRKIKEQLTSKHPNETKNELTGIITAILS